MCISYHPDYGTQSSVVSGHNRKGNIFLKWVTLFAVVFFGSTYPLPSTCIGRLHREKKDSKTGRYGVLSGSWCVGAQKTTTKTVAPSSTVLHIFPQDTEHVQITHIFITPTTLSYNVVSFFFVHLFPTVILFGIDVM